ncbi:hypothetical protein B0H13DRAFT_2012291 [Mycena leptocephala]|nr:hypothetical protein B0H13DRAFT_2012291 [Mycena leptocephala]
MARRSAPLNSGPAYIPPSQSQRHKIGGNLSLLTGVGLFVGSILAVRTWGGMMVPP